MTNRSWQGQHLINTRGCGLVLAPAGRVLESQRPDYRTVPLERPELYFSPTLSGYAIASSDVVRAASATSRTSTRARTASR